LQRPGQAQSPRLRERRLPERRERLRQPLRQQKGPHQQLAGQKRLRAQGQRQLLRLRQLQSPRRQLKNSCDGMIEWETHGD